jgi:hypothetical protein
VEGHAKVREALEHFVGTGARMGEENGVTRLADAQRVDTRKGGRGEGGRFLFQELGLGDLLGIIHGSVRSSSYIYSQILCY